ncbi:MAG TPA: dienelactone hydrolase family protein [Rhodothermia bacterium]|nr:dienelactone hydrolase family protein [Rhodothermia bacterium]
MTTISYTRPIDRSVQIAVADASIEADWTMPLDARGLVIFAQGSGSSRFSRRNRIVARNLYDEKFGTLLLDLLTPDEEREDALTAALRFDTKFLAERLIAATQWLKDQEETRGLAVGYFGTSTGAGAALLSAAYRPDLVDAVVSRGGRPDLADIALNKVKAPTLLIVGGADARILELNRWAYWRLNCERHLEIIPGASHLFEEHGAFEKATSLTSEWFDRHLDSQAHQWWRRGISLPARSDPGQYSSLSPYPTL